MIISDAIDPDLGFLSSPGSDPNEEFLMNKTYSHFNSRVSDPDWFCNWPLGLWIQILNQDPGRQNCLTEKKKIRNFVV